MAKLTDTVREFINVAGLKAKIKAVEAELKVLKSLQASVGSGRGRKAGKITRSRTAAGKRGGRGEVKETVVTYLQKNKEKGGKASDIAKASGLKKGSINQVLFALKKDGKVTQDKKRGSPFMWAGK